jgi:hypothetical protein
MKIGPTEDANISFDKVSAAIHVLNLQCRAEWKVMDCLPKFSFDKIHTHHVKLIHSLCLGVSLRKKQAANLESWTDRCRDNV